MSIGYLFGILKTTYQETLQDVLIGNGLVIPKNILTIKETVTRRFCVGLFINHTFIGPTLILRNKLPFVWISFVWSLPDVF